MGLRKTSDSFNSNSADCDKRTSNDLLKDLLDAFTQKSSAKTKNTATLKPEDDLLPKGRTNQRVEHYRKVVNRLQNGVNNKKEALIEDTTTDDTKFAPIACSTLLREDVMKDPSFDDDVDNHLEKYKPIISGSLNALPLLFKPLGTSFVKQFNNLSQSCPLLTFRDSSTCISASNTSPSDDLDDLQRIFVEENVVKQLMTYLHHGQERSGFIGSTEHLEAEKMLVIAETKIEILHSLEYLMNSASEDIVSEIRISDINCLIKGFHDSNSGLSHYILILRLHDVVHSSKIVRPNIEGLLDFGGPYIYRNMPSKSELKGELFVLNTSTATGFKRLFGKKPTPELPIMSFIGEVRVNLKNTTNESFLLQFMRDNECKYYQFTASVDIKKDQPTFTATSTQNDAQESESN